MIRRRLVLSAPLLALARCASAPPPKPTLVLTIRAGQDQNPDLLGNAAPVEIRLYQLAEVGAFDRADVFALMDRAPATLGADDLASSAFLIAPGETQQHMIDLNPNTRFVGAIALFRAIDRASWRLRIPAHEHGPTTLTLRTEALTLSAS